MSRSVAVATAEFLLLVRTRFFVVSLLLVPVMIGVSIWISSYAEHGIDREQHRVAVVDETGMIFPAILLRPRQPPRARRLRITDSRMGRWRDRW